MPKFLIHDSEGKILRTVNFPYEGTHIDISLMSDEEFDLLCQDHTDKKIDLNIDGTHKQDDRGLPIIKKKGEG
jgi:hypothetical protein